VPVLPSARCVRVRGRRFFDAGPASGPDTRRDTIKQTRLQRITPFLWFDTQAEEAVSFYTSVFKNSRIVSVARYGEAGAEVSGRPRGTVMTIAFQLDGQEFVALNGGPHFKFTEAISLVVNCESQDEVDYFWETLSNGGDEKAQQCGWLKDRYGVSWQVVPFALRRFVGGPDPEKSQRAMKAMLQMKKIDIEGLREAYEGVARSQALAPSGPVEART
jgi:predicted 3-demethylubiquinone-9 3-methyltransferase (glyoxalase superfamily)